MTGSRIGVGVRCLLMSGVLLGQGHTPGGTPKLGNNPASIYTKFGVRTIINVAGSSTRVGGATMPLEVVQAMADAALDAVSLMELQAAASQHLAKATGAEACYVTSGASAGLTLATAAILAGLDLAKMERLPDTTGMKNEVIISREHRSGYDHAIRLAGAKLVEVGMNERLSEAELRRTEAWEYEAAITDKTAAIAYLTTEDNRPPLAQVVEVARRHQVPVLVDAAGELPPDLRQLIQTGADLVAAKWRKRAQGTAIERDPVRSSGTHRLCRASAPGLGRAFRYLGSARGSDPEGEAFRHTQAWHRSRLQGRQTRAASLYSAFWFAWAAFNRDTEI